MATIDHVTLRVADLTASTKLYNQAFALLGFHGEPHLAEPYLEWGDFSIAQADGTHPPTHGAHIAFSAANREQIDTWWRELTNAGYRDDSRPGPRPIYSPDYYGAFIRDLDNNSVEAVRHENTVDEEAQIDHLWIRVSDLTAAKTFYRAIGEATGLQVRDLGERLQLVAEGASFSILEGEPTRNLHLAIGVTALETITAFYEAGLNAGGIDNGPPGERPEYHAGYYGAYLLDTDSNNIEAVVHHRPQSSINESN